jgi:hypothetical protein
VEAILAGGHEIAHRGFLHEHPREVAAEEEAHWLDRGIEVIERVTGQRPRGWRAPLYNFSHRSAELLVSRGFRYDASLMGDDQPYLLEATGGRLGELPSHWGLDDWPQYVQSIDLDYMMPIRAPEQGFEAFRQEFEAACASGDFGTGGAPLCHRPARALAGVARLPRDGGDPRRRLVRADGGDRGARGRPRCLRPPHPPRGSTALLRIPGQRALSGDQPDGMGASNMDETPLGSANSNGASHLRADGSRWQLAGRLTSIDYLAMAR